MSKQHVSEQAERYLQNVQYQAGVLKSQLRGLVFLFQNARPNESVTVDDMYGMGDLLEHLMERAEGINSALDCVTYRQNLEKDITNPFKVGSD